MDRLWSDIRHAFRGFRANPGLTAVAILSLAIGIGPNSAIFSLVDAIGFRPLPIRDAGHLVIISTATELDPDEKCSYPEYRDLRDHVRSLDSFAIAGFQAFGISGGQQAPAVVLAAQVSATYFPTLGARPMLGRTFADDEDVTGGHPARSSSRWAPRPCSA